MCAAASSDEAWRDAWLCELLGTAWVPLQLPAIPSAHAMSILSLASNISHMLAKLWGSCMAQSLVLWHARRPVHVHKLGVGPTRLAVLMSSSDGSRDAHAEEAQV